MPNLRASDMKEIGGLPPWPKRWLVKCRGYRCTQSTGAPGSSLDIKVRGVGTIYSWYLSFVCCGWCSLGKEQLSSFNMNDVESIKSKRCVIVRYLRMGIGKLVHLLLQKKGTEGRAVVTYNGYYGVQTDIQENQVC